MSRVNKIHHINFLVKDLNEAEQRYRKLLGFGPAIREGLESRGVITARFPIGESWLVLVQPDGEEGLPAEHLRQHGEGFFLLSLGVDDLEQTIADVEKDGGRLTGELRQGVEDWRIIDVDVDQTFGAQLQLADEKGVKT